MLRLIESFFYLTKTKINTTNISFFVTRTNLFLYIADAVKDVGRCTELVKSISIRPPMVLVAVRCYISIQDKALCFSFADNALRQKNLELSLGTQNLSSST